MKHNNKAATEDQVGLIHSAVTRIWQKKLDIMEDAVDKMLKPDENGKLDEDAIMNAMFLMDEKALTGAGNWAAKLNEVTYALPEEQKGNKLHSTLESIKKKQGGKLINFHDEVGNG